MPSLGAIAVSELLPSIPLPLLLLNSTVSFVHLFSTCDFDRLPSLCLGTFRPFGASSVRSLNQLPSYLTLYSGAALKAVQWTLPTGTGVSCRLILCGDIER
ncbi:hypothetical protein SAY87_021500 [Trapa incisa]|uniref:Uncharacterized protein n=1 Tax=Trapa incisa TaxID=236973 RepID=A0AAN7PQC4_9MYRT|nr:hypothetical protein SAY87_021500 [Trapa incisa]